MLTNDEDAVRIQITNFAYALADDIINERGEEQMAAHISAFYNFIYDALVIARASGKLMAVIPSVN